MLEEGVDLDLPGKWKRLKGIGRGPASRSGRKGGVLHAEFPAFGVWGAVRITKRVEDLLGC